MTDTTNAAPPPPEPILRPEARIVRADRSLATMVLFVCTLGGMGIGFGSAMYLMRAHWGAPGAYRCGDRLVLSDVGRITWLGVGVITQRSRDGAVITRVYDDTGADRAGFQRGDIIKGFEGQRIYDNDQIITAVRSRAPGEVVEVSVERNGQPMTLRARLGQM
jgi:hypothetical protein